MNKVGISTAKGFIESDGVFATKDENGVLKIGDIIIPQRKVLWSSEDGVIAESSTNEVITLSESLAAGDIIEVKLAFGDRQYRRIYKFPIKGSNHLVSESFVYTPNSIESGSATYEIYQTYIYINGTTLEFGQCYFNCFGIPSTVGSHLSLSAYNRQKTILYSITKVIE